MSVQNPLRNVRLHALQRQCVFRRQQCRFERFTAVPTIRTFSSTPRRRAVKRKAQDTALTEFMTTQQASQRPAPAVTLDRIRHEFGNMSEDIGLLQGTIIRAPFKSLPPWYSRPFRSYFWNLLKVKFSGLYSRTAYRRCKQKKGWTKWVPIDSWNKAQLCYTAEKMYEAIYRNFAKGDVRPMEKFCLPPLVAKLKKRITARLPQDMDWTLHKFKSSRIVSHRASLIGEDRPDSGFRQVIIRLESIQSLSMTYRTSATSNDKTSKIKSGWKPSESKIRQTLNSVSKESQHVARPANSVTKQTVVEYLVLQRRINSGTEEPWKVWGFTTESTPATILEDDAYFKNTIDYQVAEGA